MKTIIIDEKKNLQLHYREVDEHAAKILAASFKDRSLSNENHVFLIPIRSKGIGARFVYFPVSNFDVIDFKNESKISFEKGLLDKPIETLEELGEYLFKQKLSNLTGRTKYIKQGIEKNFQRLGVAIYSVVEMAGVSFITREWKNHGKKLNPPETVFLKLYLDKDGSLTNLFPKLHYDGNYDTEYMTRLVIQDINTGNKITSFQDFKQDKLELISYSCEEGEEIIQTAQVLEERGGLIEFKLISSKK